MPTITADYLVIGAGAMGLAFTDALLTETQASVAIVDRYGRPGGHWNRAYPFVRLHQPSAFYGVNSRALGSDLKDAAGWNAGLFELASGAEVLAYFDQVMNQQFQCSGRVTYHPMCDYGEGGAVVSLASGERQDIVARTTVDAAYLRVSAPSMRPPPYEVAEGVRCSPPNVLTTSEQAAGRYVVIGAGKTGIDTCLWLLAVGVDPDCITWIMPRDAWLLDRENIQPGAEFFEQAVGGLALQLEASALATSVDDLFERLEASGQLLRIDPHVRPAMYRCATVTRAELDQLRRIRAIVRIGRVRSVGLREIVLDHGSIATTPDTHHIDCSADGAQRRPTVPVFEGEQITLQSVRTCQPVFSAALIAHVEATGADEAEKNAICAPFPYPYSDLDWLRTTLANTIATLRWSRDAALTAWISGSRLDLRAGRTAAPGPEQMEFIRRIGRHAEPAIANLRRLLADVGDA